MTEGRLHLMEFAASFEQLRPELVAQVVEVQIVDPRFPSGGILSQSLEADLLNAKDSVLLPVPAEGEPSALFSVVGNTAPVTINLPHAVLVHGSSLEIVQSLSGGVKYSAEDKTLLALIESLDDKVEALRLRSELDRLKDVATRPEERRTAVQKLKSFLYAGSKYVGRKVDDVGTKVLVAYLERLLTGRI